jgi:Protein of unknown function (DUF1573)
MDSPEDRMTCILSGSSIVLVFSPHSMCLQGVTMNMKAMLGTILALVLAIAGTAFLAARAATPPPKPPAPIPVGIANQLEVNPFDLTAPGPRSKVVAEKIHFDFPVMALGKTEFHDFEFKNMGEGPLRLAKGPLMCKCTMPTVPDNEVKTGESMMIRLEWKPLEMATDFRKEAVIWTNDPAKPKIILSIKGQVIPDPGLFPSEFGLGDIAWDRDVEAAVTIASAVSDDLMIESAEVSDPKWMSVTWVKDAGDKPIPKPKSSFTVKLKIIPNETEGPFVGWVKLKLNRNDGTQEIRVVGARTGPISIYGKEYQAASSMIDMKKFKSSEGIAKTLFIRLKPFGEDLQIKGVISKSKFLTATLKKKSTGESKDSYELVVEGVKGATPGTVFTAEIPDEMILQTNHPQVPELKFKARYVVQ